MASFFEKLKKGMGIEEIEERVEEKQEKSEPAGIPKKRRAAEASTLKKAKTKKPAEEMKRIEIKTAVLEEKTELEAEKKKETKEFVEKTPQVLKMKEPAEKKEKWPGLGTEPEGQLAVDVCQTEDYLIIQSAIAGVGPETLDISIEKDIISIKGWREKQLKEDGDYFTQECYWGPFSREVILPVEVDPDRIQATMKECVLTIKIPKIIRDKKRKISIKNI
jgi:HSP20 family protein